MRKLTKLLTGTAAAAIALSFVASGVASADPVNSSGKAVTPQSFDVVSVGSDTIEYLLDQLSVNYNAAHKTHNANNPYIYSWDATLPGATSSAPTKIVPKAGCAKITRPDGSSAGISALDNNVFDGKTGHYCLDFARSSRGRASTDPKETSGGIIFIALAKDAVTYATRDKASGGTDAPANLSTAQLKSIYLCKVTNWKQVGGKNAAIKPFLPQTGSGTRAFFLQAIGVTTPGTCVNSSVQENEGTNSKLNNGNSIVPFSTAKYIAEVFHSAKCGKKPGKGQNLFGCDDHGVLGLNSINGTKATATANGLTVINPSFTKTFTRLVYDVVRYDTKTPDHILPRLEPFFASAHAKVKGWFCSNSTAIKDIENYGFLTTPLCGSGS